MRDFLAKNYLNSVNDENVGETVQNPQYDIVPNLQETQVQHESKPKLIVESFQKLEKKRRLSI